MPDIDIKSLLTRLDATCLSYIDAATQFCVKNEHETVSAGHLLLIMLDNRQNPLNLLLDSVGILPVDWIRQLLVQIDGYKNPGDGKPAFGDSLLRWLHASASDGSEQSYKAAIHLEDLLTTLVDTPQTFELDGLQDMGRLTTEKIVRFFSDRREDSTPAPSDSSDTPDDATVIMTDDELSSSFDRSRSTVPVINGYSGIERIGDGGMATVYRARHIGLDREVAIKVLRPELAMADTGEGGDDSVVERFLREARIVAKLSHPNIIQIYDINQQDNISYIAMEFVSGGELAERIEDGFSIDEIRNILIQVLSALQSAHDKGYIHRDIKPANILFREDGSVVLTDFGIARAMTEDSGMTIAGSVLGTPRYMSPDQAKGDELDNRSDLYSVGVLFFHMLEGRLPYKGDSAMGTAMKHILDPIPELSADLSRHQAFINRAMAKDADDRFQSGEEMIQALERLS